MTGSADDSGPDRWVHVAPGDPRDHDGHRDGMLVRVERASPDDAALIQDAQALLEAFAGRDAASLLASVTELCRLLASRGATRRAELLLRQMLPIGEEHLDRDHVALGHVLHELAHVQLREGRYLEAEPLLLRLYYMQCRRCGKDHPDAAAVLASLARVRQALGHHDDAEAMWRQVISVCERSLGSQHVATTTAVERLAESCAARGKHHEAVQLRAQASSMRDTPMLRPLPAFEDWIEHGEAPRLNDVQQPELPALDESVASPARPALVVLPSPNGALTIEEQPRLAPAGSAAHDALRAIRAELEATSGDQNEAGGHRSWRAFVAAAAVLMLLGGLTASGAASTFGARPDDGSPTWAAWNPPAPSAPPADSGSTRPAGTALYEVRLAAEAAGQSGAPTARPMTRARLIGAVPRLPFPPALSDRRTDDEVVVRFVVDAAGMPDTASFAVVRTPHDMLTEVVRRAIPGLRFEPARRAIPGASGEPDVVEMSFRFSRAIP